MVSNRRTKKKRDEGQESEGTDFEIHLKISSGETEVFMNHEILS